MLLLSQQQRDRIYIEGDSAAKEICDEILADPVPDDAAAVVAPAAEGLSVHVPDAPPPEVAPQTIRPTGQV